MTIAHIQYLLDESQRIHTSHANRIFNLTLATESEEYKLREKFEYIQMEPPLTLDELKELNEWYKQFENADE